MAKYTTVTIWTKNAIISLQVINICNEIMHQVMLLSHITHSILYFRIEITKNSLEKQECPKVFMIPRWCLKENPNTLKLHHIISNIEKAWIKFWFYHVQNILPSVCPLKFSEMLLSQVNKSLVLNISSSNDSHILSIIHPLMVPNNHFSIDLIDIMNLPQNR